MVEIRITQNNLQLGIDYLNKCADITNDYPHTFTMCDIEGNVGGINHGYIRSIQIHNRCVNNNTYFFDFNEVDINLVLPLLTKLHTVWANPSFDFGWIGETLKAPYLTKQIDDVQQLGRLAYPRLVKTLKKFALDNLIKHVTKIDAYAGLVKKDMQLAFTKEAIITEDMLRYACSDVYYLYDLWMDDKIQAQRKNWSYRMDMLSLRSSLVYQRNGILIKLKEGKEELVKAEAKVANTEEAMLGISANSYQKVRFQLQSVESDKDALLRFMGGDRRAYNTSTIEVTKVIAGLLRRNLGGKPNEKERHTLAEELKQHYLGNKELSVEFKRQVLGFFFSDNMEDPELCRRFKTIDFPSTYDFDYLMEDDELERRISFATAVFNQRRNIKRVTGITQLVSQPAPSYGVDENDEVIFSKMQTFFNPYGTLTGRFNSKSFDFTHGINAQQITRDLQYLTYFNTTDTVVVHADFSTAELRCACSIMGDYQMRKYLLQGIDLHKVSATLANKLLKIEDVTKEQRQGGKAVSFGYIFGMGIKTFIETSYATYGVLFTESESKEIKKAYLEQYPEIAKYHSLGWDSYEKTVAKSPSGRVSLSTTGNAWINYATQSGIADVTKLAVHYMVKEYGDVVLKYIFNVVHDAIYMRVPKGEEAKWSRVMTDNMFKAWFEYLKFPMFKFKDIPMGVEYEYQDSVTGKEICIEEFKDEL